MAVVVDELSDEELVVVVRVVLVEEVVAEVEDEVEVVLEVVDVVLVLVAVLDHENVVIAKIVGPYAPQVAFTT